MIITLNGILKIFMNSLEGIELGEVYKVDENGHQDVYMTFSANISVASANSPTIKIESSDGTVEIHNPYDGISNLYQKSKGNTAKEKALRLISSSANLNWSDLYRIFEVVENDVGTSQVTSWLSNALVERFTHSANSVTAAGDQARHGKEKTKPPKNPMPIDEARSMIFTILRKWIMDC